MSKIDRLAAGPALWLAGVLLVHHHALGLGFWADDHWFATLCSGSPLSLLDVHNGWFWRPAHLLWWWSLLRVGSHSPVALHAGNLLLHAVNLWLLARLVARASGSRWLGVGAAALMLAWSASSSAVEWCSCSSTLLAAVGVQGALWFAWTHAAHGRWHDWLLALVFLALGLGAKEEAVLAVPLLLTAGWCAPRHRRLLGCSVMGVVVVWALLWRAAFAHFHGIYDAPAQHAGSLARLWYAARMVQLGPCGVVPVGWPALLLLAIIVRAVRSHRVALGSLAVLLLAPLPLALSLGAGSLADRFCYLPNLAACACLALVSRALWQTDRLLVLALLSAVAATLHPVWVHPWLLTGVLALLLSWPAVALPVRLAAGVALTAAWLSPQWSDGTLVGGLVALALYGHTAPSWATLVVASANPVTLPLLAAVSLRRTRPLP